MNKGMKRIVTFLVLSFLAALTAINASAQRNDPGKTWRDRIQSQKIAFLTSEMDLNPQEAQTFWPIYNQNEKARLAATEATFKAFRALDEATKSGKSEKELAELVKAYGAAMANASALDSKFINDYLKVISGEKVAKLFVAEEKFRQEQIHKLRQPFPQPPQGGMHMQQAPKDNNRK